MAKPIKIPDVTWSLGDSAQETISGVTVVTRAIYYRPKGQLRAIQVGVLNPDYAEAFIAAVSK